MYAAYTAWKKIREPSVEVEKKPEKQLLPYLAV